MTISIPVFALVIMLALLLGEAVRPVRQMVRRFRRLVRRRKPIAPRRRRL